MTERIQLEIQKLEAEGFKVLYTCESGSRAWGFESKDSDFDVRFIYAQPQESYLTVFDFKDTKDYPIDDLLDLNGWDLKKALRLLSNNNMSIAEWINSPIVYYEKEEFSKTLKELQEKVFCPSKALGHYLGTARSTWSKHLKEETFNVKKIFYALRPLLACRWVLKFRTMPPVTFQKMLIDELISPELAARVRQLIEEKKDLTEKDNCINYEDLRQYVKKEIKKLSIKKIKPNETNDKNSIDKVFRRFLS
ncbi:MAG: nucleotidyltransferase domain-containing protein [Lentisphaeraceae bacterium]|nr:nucleotidyltransferase domain-containing protein [Lentisphaeraceae bacterium]